MIMEVNKSDVTFPSPQTQPQPSGSASTPAPMTSQKPTSSTSSAQPGRRKQAKPQRKTGKLLSVCVVCLVVRDVCLHRTPRHGTMANVAIFAANSGNYPAQTQDHQATCLHIVTTISHSDSQILIYPSVTKDFIQILSGSYWEVEWKTLFFISSGHWDNKNTASNTIWWDLWFLILFSSSSVQLRNPKSVPTRLVQQQHQRQ